MFPQEDIDLLWRCFPDLTPVQQDQFLALGPVYLRWNEMINVVSRKDIHRLYLHHILHSLTIARFVSFIPGSSVLDVGTGGGFPGIPLAVMFPDTRFVLVDSIGKKLKVVEAAAAAAGLSNVEVRHIRAEHLQESFDFVVSRAVTSLPDFVQWVRLRIAREHRHTMRNGILYLKGGDLTGELSSFGNRVSVTPLSQFVPDIWFEEKKLVYLAF